MSDNATVTPANNSAYLSEISLCVYQAILELQQQQPALLKEKYRNVPWQKEQNRLAFQRKLEEGLRNIDAPEALILKVQKFLQALLLPRYFELPLFPILMEKIGCLAQQRAEFNNSPDVDSSQPTVASLSPTSRGLAELSPGIAILLLDAENLQLNANTEKFLLGVCTYPIQIKIAFANWRSMGKQDVELHKRGYELIHVPAGKDSADVKMATVGSSIFVHYPGAKEVLVCSSDGVLSHLATTLQTHGLTVYLVRKQGDNITVFNSKTYEIQIHSLKPLAEIPSVEQFITQLKELIKLEQKRTNNQWIKLTKISKLFQVKYQFTISQVVSHHFPGKRARDVFIDNPADFVVHQISEQSELYVSCFEISASTPVVEGNFSQLPDSQTQVETSAEIRSRTDLEQVLVQIIKDSTAHSPGSEISLNTLGTLFQQRYGQGITTAIKQLQLNYRFINFLRSSSAFELKQTGKGWQVAVRVDE